MAIMNRPNLPTSSSEQGSIAGYSRNLLAHPTHGISRSWFLCEVLGWNPIGPRFRPQDCTALQLHHISALGKIMPQTPSLALLSGRTKCLVPRKPKPMTLAWRAVPTEGEANNAWHCPIASAQVPITTMGNTLEPQVLSWQAKSFPIQDTYLRIFL